MIVILGRSSNKMKRRKAHASTALAVKKVIPPPGPCDLKPSHACSVCPGSPAVVAVRMACAAFFSGSSAGFMCFFLVSPCFLKSQCTCDWLTSRGPPRPAEASVRRPASPSGTAPWRPGQPAPQAGRELGPRRTPGVFVSKSEPR